MADQKKPAVEETRKVANEQTAKAVEANSGIKTPSASAMQKAQQDGVVDAIKENAKDAYQALTDGNLPGEPAGKQYIGMDDIMLFEPILALPIAEFEDRIKNNLAEEKAAGLLSLERAGQNRTPYVKALCARLGVKSPFEVTNAGPDYTNDVSPISGL